MKKIFVFFAFIAILFACGKGNNKTTEQPQKQQPAVITPGAEQADKYLPLLQGKRVGIVVNQSSLVGKTHLLDFLLKNNIDVVKIFTPEHGFRGTAGRGEHVNDSVDTQTGIPIISLFGDNRKPKPEHIADLDVIVYDIQDAGARFFTYISTLYLVMQACAENDKPLIVFDRPNPLGDYVDGPVLDTAFRSFVGMLPIPVVHGLTLGEAARMINGENWLNTAQDCDLTVIPVANYDHTMHYSLPVKPSPNLPNDLAIRLYPSLCFFEATDVSVGRGTDFPFQVIGYPDPKFGDFTFTPVDKPGMQINPVQEGKLCYGIDLRNLDPQEQKFTLKYFIDFYNKSGQGEKFFKRIRWFNLLAGTDKLAKQIISGLSEEQIKQTWQPELEKYKEMRKKYLLYKDFE